MADIKAMGDTVIPTNLGGTTTNSTVCIPTYCCLRPAKGTLPVYLVHLGVDVGTYQYNTRYTVRLGFYTLYAYVPATPCYSDV